MKIIAVWMLLYASTGYYNGGTMTVIDNLASQSECEFLRAKLAQIAIGSSRCVRVSRVVPK